MVQLPARMAAKTSSKIKARHIQALQWNWPLLYKQPLVIKFPHGASCDGAGERGTARGPGGDGTPNCSVDRGQAGCSKAIISILLYNGPVTSEDFDVAFHTSLPTATQYRSHSFLIRACPSQPPA